MRDALVLAIALAAAVLGGCARSAKGPELPKALADFERDPRPFIAHVGRIRGLREKRPTKIVFHDEAGFRAALERELASDQGQPTAADTGAFFLSFGFQLPSKAAKNTPADVQREQVIAFYDDRAHAVHVRRPSTLSEAEQRTAELVWAHEIGHALQHDNFQVPAVRKIADDDSFLASMALLEGDAMLVMLAYASVEERVPLKRTLVRAGQSLERGSLNAYLRTAADTKALMSAPPIVRERLMFPYLSGLAFMGALHRAGGFALVNRAYSHPPVTTEQVLHPDRYLAGETAIEVAPPDVPPGFERLASGRMGELQTRITLETCNSARDAELAATGWGGDAYSIVRDRDGSIALLWATAWDSEPDAIEFERAVDRAARCWRKTPGAEGAVFSDGARVVRRGTHVAVLRGLDSSEAASEALLKLPSAPMPPSPPFGAITIPPIRRVPPTRPPYVSQGQYVNERLGIMAPILPGYGVGIDRDGTLTLSRNWPTPATGFIGISDWVVTQSGVDETFRHFAQGVQKAVDDVANAEIRVAADPGRVRTPLGIAVERVWAVERSDVRIRLLMLPICRGNGSLLFAQLWSDDATKAQLDWWLGALRPLSEGAPPICAELDP
jgi:hypothetical protein